MRQGGLLLAFVTYQRASKVLAPFVAMLLAVGCSKQGGSVSTRPAFLSVTPYNLLGCQHEPVVEQCSDGWCRIPAGCFVMGSPDTEWGRGLNDEEMRKVTFSHAFMIQKYETTQEEWTAAGFRNPSGPAAVTSDGTDCLEPSCPVGHVNWYEILAYANYLSGRHSPPLKPCYVLDSCSGEIGTNYSCTTASLAAPTAYQCEGFRLPTEAEWEYAARAGTRTAFYSGEITQQKDTGSCYPESNLDSIAWYCKNSNKTTHPVGQKILNAWGLYDTLGNASEWVQDDATDWTKVPSGPALDPCGTLQFLSASRIIRGGCWNCWSPELRASWRLGASPAARGTGGGFRLVRSIVDGHQIDANDGGDGG